MFAPETLGPTVIITAYSLTGISTLVVILRFYCRIWVVGKLKSYDYIMLAALLCTWAVCVDNHIQIHFGTGEHPIPPHKKQASHELIQYRKTGSARSWYAYQILYLADLAIIKFSVLFFYLSIATERTFRNLVYVTMAITGVASVALIMVNAIECPRNPSLALRPDIFTMRKEWGCFDLVPIYYAAAAFNIFSDAFILILPLPVLLKLRMHTLKRVSLLILFSVGVLVPISSGIRLWAILLWANSGPRARFYGGYVIFWSGVELNTAIICASAPSLQPLIKRIFGEVARYRGRSAYYYYGGGSHGMSDVMPAQRRVIRDPHNISDIDTLPDAYPATENKSSRTDLSPDVVFVREMDEEDELRDRIRRFASHRSSANSHPPKSPARPHDILAHG